MKKYTLYRETTLPITIEEAWAFFSNPLNLARITPKEMAFNVVSKNLPAHIHNGLKINYIVKPVLGIPMPWLSEISKVNAPYFFVDEQLKGPYAYWHHEHTFEEVKDGVLMKDEVTYSVPLGFLGQFANWLFVRKKLAQIFDYRTAMMAEIFKSSK